MTISIRTPMVVAMATRLIFKLSIMSANLGRIRTERAKTGLARVGKAAVLVRELAIVRMRRILRH